MPADSLSLVLDQGVPRDAARMLRDLGYQCAHVGEIGMSKSQDSLIIQLAAEKSAIILTLDADFHTILAVSGAPGPSVIRVRIEGLDARAFVAVTQNVLAQLEDELKAGCLITVKARKTTCHRLPIGGTD